MQTLHIMVLQLQSVKMHFTFAKVTFVFKSSDYDITLQYWVIAKWALVTGLLVQTMHTLASYSKATL